MILFQIKTMENKEELENMLIFSESASFSLGYDYIYASFTQKQFNDFSFKYFFNYKKVIFAEMIEI